MSILQAIVLGVVQGLTEFLPVSSSGHLIFIPKLFGWPDQGISFDVFIHLATLLAVVVFFRQKIWSILKSCIQYKSQKQEDVLNRKLFGFIILSIIPAGIVGFFGGDWIEENLRSPIIVAIDMMFWGLVLGAAEWWSKKKNNNQNFGDMNIQKASVMGIAQAIALLPGTSRSGITMTSGIFAGLTKKSAAEFSFLMSIPIIALAGAVDVLKMTQGGVGEIGIAPLVAGFLAAAISGFLAITLLLKMIEKWSLKPFVIYRIIMGILILIFLV